MTNSPVRLALPDDEDAIMELCQALHKENGQHSYDPVKVRGMVRRAILQQGGIIGVIGERGDLKGCIYLLLDPVWYSNEYQLLELFNFVRSDSRSAKLGYAVHLIEYAKARSDELNIDLTIGVLSNIRMEAKVRIYSRLLPKAGEFFVHSPKSSAVAIAS